MFLRQIVFPNSKADLESNSNYSIITIILYPQSTYSSSNIGGSSSSNKYIGQSSEAYGDKLRFEFLIEGRVLAAETLLGIALQRGSLQNLLEWIEMAMLTSATSASDEEGNFLYDNIYITSNKLQTAIQTIRQAGSSDLVSSEVLQVSLYDCAFLLMDEVKLEV
jgi:hypothetical protein